jgi:hypothetical protein
VEGGDKLKKYKVHIEDDLYTQYMQKYEVVTMKFPLTVYQAALDQLKEKLKQERKSKNVLHDS